MTTHSISISVLAAGGLATAAEADPAETSSIITHPSQGEEIRVMGAEAPLVQFAVFPARHPKADRKERRQR